MADKPLPWFRFYHEAATDSKFDVISMTTGIEWCSVFGAWAKILCIAASSPIRGSLYVTLQKRYSNANVTALLRYCNEQSEAIMQAFIDCDMLDIDDNGAYRVKNWDKRQYASDSSTGRVRKHRKLKDETLQERDSNGDVTSLSVSVSDSSYSVLGDENKTHTEEVTEWLDEDSAITKLSKQFEVSAQMTAYDLEKWEDAIREMFHGGVSPELLGKVIFEMRNPPPKGRKLTITGPWSCKGIAIGKAAELRAAGAITQNTSTDEGGAFYG